MRKISFLVFIVICFIPSYSLSETVSDYLILNQIGPYKLEKKFVTSVGLLIESGQPKVSAGGDEAEGYYTSYTVGYDGGENLAGPDVIVRVYDSPKWMLLDLERGLKEYKDGVLTKTNKAAITKSIDGNQVIKARIGGGTYRWISNDKAIIISYRDLQLEYPVPIEVISAYLKKYPSTLPETYQIRHPDREKEFIREEFERLITISERWVALLQKANPDRSKILLNTSSNLVEFAEYRRVYFAPLFGFFGDQMAEDIVQLEEAYMRSDQEEFIRAKLAEYKEWWAAHKAKTISFP